jgi:hypothetical protein
VYQLSDVRDKNFTFRLFLNFLIFLWIVEQIFIVADVNTHSMVCHTYRVSAFLQPFLMKKSEFNVVFYIPRIVRFI